MTVLAVLGRADDAVLQTAAQLGETLAVVIASTAPPAERLSALAARAGVSRVIQIWDTALAEPLKDTLEREPVTVTLLTSLLRQIEIKTLVVGDGRHAWLAPPLAEDLDLPHVTSVLNAVPAPVAGTGKDILIQRRCLHGCSDCAGQPAVSWRFCRAGRCPCWRFPTRRVALPHGGTCRRDLGLAAPGAGDR